MAGIGFSINELMQDKENVSRPRAYAYASIITTGPMILGILVVFAIYLLCSWAQVSMPDRNLIVSIITYGLLASLVVNGFGSLVISRYLSDKLYTRDTQGFLATYWGSQFILVLTGGLLYGIFLAFSGISFVLGLLAWGLFCELVMTWNSINFLTVIKDYQSIFRAFMITIVVTLLAGVIFALFKFPMVIAMLWAILLGYASFIVQVSLVLTRQFPQQIIVNELFQFLNYFDNFWKLSLIGGLTQVGMVSHVVIVWYSPIGQEVMGLFRVAPYYDLSVFIASLTTLITTINFVVVTEVDFAKASHRYYRLFYRRGSLHQLREAEDNMLATLQSSLKSIGWQQLVTTLLAISFGLAVLRYLPLGFNDTMGGYYRVLCVAYAIYAIANVMVLSSSYFGNLDNVGHVFIFTLVSTAASYALLHANTLYYGFGFLLGAIVYYILSWLDLEKASSNLFYQVLGHQPIVAQREPDGPFHRLNRRLTQKARKNLRKGSVLQGSSARRRPKSRR